jgi:hypothetical protein
MVLSHRFLFSALAAALTLFSFSTVSAYADVITGFEAPAYTAGLPLAGQNGWLEFGPAIVTVENTFAFAGSQAVFVDGGASAVSQSGPYIATTAGPLVDLSAEIWLSSSTSETEWQFAQLGANLQGFAAGIDFIPTSDPTTNNIEALTNGFPVIGTFTRDQWNNVGIDLDFTTQTYSVVLNGVTLSSNLPFCGVNHGACTNAPISNVNADGLFDTLGGVSGSNDDAFIDNYSDATVAATPEPSVGILCLVGLAGLAVVRRKRAA